MNRSHVLVCGGAIVVAVLVALAIVPPAALADTSKIGKNLGDEVKALATALFLGVAALVAIPVLTLPPAQDRGAAPQAAAFLGGLGGVGLGHVRTPGRC